MKPRIFPRNRSGEYRTHVSVSGPIGSIQLRIVSRLSPRQRRTIAVAFFRQVKPFLKYFRNGEVLHFENLSCDFERIRERGLNIPSCSDFNTGPGKLGLAIRIQRLEKGWTQIELAKKAGISDRHLSKIERGCCQVRRYTFERLENALQSKLPEIPQSGVQPRIKVSSYRTHEDPDETKD